MRRLVFPLLLAAALAGCARAPVPLPVPRAAPDALRVATWNIHFVDRTEPQGRWSLAAWRERRTAVDGAFKALAADVVALQEAELRDRLAGAGRESPAVAWLLARNPAFRVAVRGGGVRVPAPQPIFYRHARLRLESQGWLPFSGTTVPLDAPGPNAAAPTFATWARLLDRRSGRRLLFVNVHLDHRAAAARRVAARRLERFLAPHLAEGDAVVVAGDLNARRASRTVRLLRGAGLVFPPVHGATFHFNMGLDLFGAIDHIAHGPGVEAAPPQVLRERFDGRWPSDHYPVVVDLHLRRR